MKGGVGKTSLVANIAGLIAAAEHGGGNRVLAVDLDPQGSLGRDLGYYDAEGRDDKGAGLFAAATTGTSLSPLSDVRPGLDVIAGGPCLEDLIAVVAAQQARGNSSPERVVSDALEGLSDNYGLVLIDCPPGSRLLIDIALSAAHYVLIPTKTDDASLDGLAFVAQRFSIARASSNPNLQLLGVVMFGVGRGATRVMRRAREAVEADLGGLTAPVPSRAAGLAGRLNVLRQQNPDESGSEPAKQEREDVPAWQGQDPVSYTHLTLPTKRIV